MALRDAVLAALLEGEASGYDLAKRFDRSVANFWTATPQQLYRELDRLATDGLIEARVVPQQRRPTKRLYTLTTTGHDAIRAFTCQQPKPTYQEASLPEVQAKQRGWGQYREDRGKPARQVGPCCPPEARWNRRTAQS